MLSSRKIPARGGSTEGLDLLSANLDSTVARKCHNCHQGPEHLQTGIISSPHSPPLLTTECCFCHTQVTPKKGPVQKRLKKATVGTRCSSQMFRRPGSHMLAVVCQALEIGRIFKAAHLTAFGRPVMTLLVLRTPVDHMKRFLNSNWGVRNQESTAVMNCTC